MIVRELITRLGFNTDDAKVQHYDRALVGVANTAKRVVQAVGLIGGAVGGIVTRFTMASTETLNFAERLGISTTELQRLSAAAAQYGVNNDAMIDGLKELSLRTDEFIHTAGGPALEAFQRLGFSVEDMKGLTEDTGELFRVVQERVADIEDAGARQRIADELFGGTAAEQFTEFLQLSREEIDRMGDEAERFGQVIPEETLHRAREFSRNFTILKGIVAGLANVIAEDLLPVIEELTGETREWFLENREIIRQRLSDFFERFISVVRKLISIIRWLVGSLGGLENTIKLVVAAWALWKFASIVVGIASITSATKLGTLALVAMQAKLLLLGAGFLLVLDDIRAWQNGQDSIMGELLGDWETFADNLIDTLANWGEAMLRLFWNTWDRIVGVFRWAQSEIMGIVDSIRNSFVGDIFDGIGAAIGKARELASILPGGVDYTLAGAGAGGGNVSFDPVGGGVSNAQTNNFNVNSTVQVPAGTTQEQADFLTRANNDAVRKALNEAIRESAGDFPRAE